MMISPLVDSSPFKIDNWRTSKTPQIEAKLLSTIPQFSLHPPPVSKSALGLVPNQNAYEFLVVDDNEINLRIFRRVLKKLFPNSLVDTIQDSREVKPENLLLYKIVFLDIEMPNVTGVDIATAVRLRPALETLGLVAVTTKSSAEDLKIYEGCGFDLTIPKPVHRGYSGILREIEQVLEMRCGENPCDPEMARILDEESAPFCSSGLISGDKPLTASFNASTTSDPSTLQQPGRVLLASRAAATAAVSELLLSVSQGDFAPF